MELRIDQYFEICSISRTRRYLQWWTIVHAL